MLRSEEVCKALTEEGADGTGSAVANGAAVDGGSKNVLRSGAGKNELVSSGDERAVDPLKADGDVGFAKEVDGGAEGDAVKDG